MLSVFNNKRIVFKNLKPRFKNLQDVFNLIIHRIERVAVLSKFSYFCILNFMRFSYFLPGISSLNTYRLMKNSTKIFFFKEFKKSTYLLNFNKKVDFLKKIFYFRFKNYLEYFFKNRCFPFK